MGCVVAPPPLLTAVGVTDGVGVLVAAGFEPVPRPFEPAPCLRVFVPWPCPEANPVFLAVAGCELCP